MKRLIALALAAMMAAAVFAGCGGNNTSASKADTASADATSAESGVDLTAVLDKINTENNLSLEKVDTTKKLKRYYGIEEEDVKQYAAEMDKSDTNAPVEIVLVEGVDAGAADRIESALQTRYDSVLNTYTSYTPEKVDMVKACKVTKDGKFVSLIIADNADAMVSTFQSSIK